jgi:hypothetical protein
MKKLYLKKRIKNFIGRIGLTMLLYGAEITREEYCNHIILTKSK